MTQKFIGIHRNPPPQNEFLRCLAQLEREREITAAQRHKHTQAHKYISHQQALYERLKSSLVPEFEGKYIAFEEGEVLDSDASSEALTLRLYTLRGQNIPLIVRVQSGEPVVQMGSSF